MNTKRVAIVGAAGYSGEELVRLLLGHPHVELVAVTSRPYAGQTIAQALPQFGRQPHAKTLHFTQPNVAVLAKQAEIVFLALPHGVAAEYARPLLQAGCTVIDLSADFRLRSAAVYQEFYGQEHPAPELLEKAVYGLPEIYRTQIKQATLVAAPGCYPTSVLLPLIPLLKAGLVHPNGIVATALSGVSGAGRKAEVDYLFCECHESLRAYAVPKHRHLSEMEQELSLAAGARVTLQFTPHLVPANRGILTTMYLTPQKTFTNAAELFQLTGQIEDCYQAAYGAEPFVQLLAGKALPDTKHVVDTNGIQIAWRVDPRTGRLVVISALDNLIKGAGGQAVQCMNLLCGFPETAGLV